MRSTEPNAEAIRRLKALVHRITDVGHAINDTSQIWSRWNEEILAIVKLLDEESK